MSINFVHDALQKRKKGTGSRPKASALLPRVYPPAHVGARDPFSTIRYWRVTDHQGYQAKRFKKAVTRDLPAGVPAFLFRNTNGRN
jgi:hypothetical protein